jgi:Sulfotransferase domain
MILVLFAGGLIAKRVCRVYMAPALYHQLLEFHPFMPIGHKIRVVLRQAAVGASIVLPRDKNLRFERHLRGKEDLRMLGQSDVVIVSHGKSGRTWLRVLLSHYYHIRYGLPHNRLLADDNLHNLNSKVPRVFFTHDNYLGDYTGSHRSKQPYANLKVVLLVRHPADTAVSQYHQWKHRMRGRKKFINGYPASEATPLFDFVIGEEAGIPKIVNFMNAWADAIEDMRSLLVVRYESLRSDTAATLARILDFLGESPTAKELQDCVEFASIENMRAMEQGTFFKGIGDRMKPGDVANPQSYKVRRAKAGGYRDDFGPEQISGIDALIATTLSPIFGYSGAPPGPCVV